MHERTRLSFGFAFAGLVALSFCVMVLGLHALGHLDWQACIENTGLRAPAALRVAQMNFWERITTGLQGGIVDGILEWPIISHPKLAILAAMVLFAPPFLLALPVVPSRSYRRRHAFALAVFAFFLAAFVIMPEAADQHDCDRKGNTSFLLFSLLPLLAGLLGAAATIASRHRSSVNF